MVKTTNRHGKEKDKPNVMKIYNENMSGIDRSDQMLYYHSGLRKTIRWNKKVGIHLMEVMLSNAYYMYASVTPCRNVKNIKDFREVVVESLIGPPRKKWLMRPQLNFHCLSAIPATEKKKTPTRRCQHCSSKENRKESRYQCLKCEKSPALCVDPCFQQFHVSIGVALEDSESDASGIEYDNLEN